MAASVRLIGPKGSRDGRVNYDLSISSLGNLNFPQNFGSLRLEAIFGPATNALRGEQILGTNALTGRLAFTFTTHEAVLDRATALCILNEAVAWLSQATGPLESKRCRKSRPLVHGRSNARTSLA